MPIDTKDFPNKVDVGLKSNSSYNKFLYRFKNDGQTKRGVIDYSDKNWDKRTRVNRAKVQLQQIKETSSNQSTLLFTENSTLNNVAELYFSTLQDTKWTHKRIASYNLYLKSTLGRIKIKDIKKVHIDTLRRRMEIKGKSKQTENGCSPRTIIQVLSKILKPLLQYAVDNDVLTKIPKVDAPSIPKESKKKVANATHKFVTLYKAILILYKDDSFYRALFLFALYGRRWNEIRTLRWSDIDFLNNTYTIRAENNKAAIEQTYDLAPVIVEALNHFTEKQGIIFKSPITQDLLFPPKRQLQKLRDFVEIPELTMHYFRHILVSAMGESGVADSILTATLGHSVNSNLVKTTYQTINHQKSSAIANLAIENITKEDN